MTLPAAALAAPGRRPTAPYPRRVVDSASAAVLLEAAASEAAERRRSSSRRSGDRTAAAVLDVLPSGAVVVDGAGCVVLVNPAARSMGVTDEEGEVLALTALSALADACRRTGAPQEEVVTLPQRLEHPFRRPRRDRAGPALRVRAVPLPEPEPGSVALLLDDVTEQRRVDAVRRDFVANVSHELKTPVGALHLLAEAISESPDEPATVRRFAARMTTESQRLSNLVQELIDLSRLQGAEPMRSDNEIAVAAVVAEAVDRARLAAEAKDMAVVVGGDANLLVTGDERQLVTAVANLLDNAVAYSPVGTRVAVGMVSRDGWVEVSVADEGIGIAERDQERVFERFYRVDAARSRQTGGTGLGLSIVKHVATNHGGEVALWSREGAGATFTLRLPEVGTPEPRGGSG